MTAIFDHRVIVLRQKSIQMAEAEPHRYLRGHYMSILRTCLTAGERVGTQNQDNIVSERLYLITEGIAFPVFEQAKCRCSSGHASMELETIICSRLRLYRGVAEVADRHICQLINHRSTETCSFGYTMGVLTRCSCMRTAQRLSARSRLPLPIPCE